MPKGDFKALKAECASEFELYRGPREWKPGLNTHRFNMEEALSRIEGDYILILEDDDYYAPTYIEEMVKLLSQADIVGEVNAKYYNLKIPGFRQMGNTHHASLAQTGITKDALPYLQAAVDSGELYFDIHLWRAAFQHKIPMRIFANKNLCVGMKGLPGRAGIGAGHRMEGYRKDYGLEKLTEWLGADAEIYKPFITENYDRPERKLLPRKSPPTARFAVPGAGNGQTNERPALRGNVTGASIPQQQRPSPSSSGTKHLLPGTSGMPESVQGSVWVKGRAPAKPAA